MTYDSGNKRDFEKTNFEREECDLKWSEHVDRMVRKANRILGRLREGSLSCGKS